MYTCACIEKHLEECPLKYYQCHLCWCLQGFYFPVYTFMYYLWFLSWVKIVNQGQVFIIQIMNSDSAVDSLVSRTSTFGNISYRLSHQIDVCMTLMLLMPFIWFLLLLFKTILQLLPDPNVEEWYLSVGLWFGYALIPLTYLNRICTHGGLLGFVCLFCFIICSRNKNCWH